MDKTYKAIKTIERLGMILSNIVFVFCIVGAVGCFIGIVALSITGNIGLVIDGKDLATIIEESSGKRIEDTICTISTALIMIGGEIALSYISKEYFRKELARKEVFTEEGAKELKNFGIFAIVIPIVSYIVATIVYSIFSVVLHGVGEFNIEFGGSIGLGIMFILLSIFVQYGAEMNKNENDNSKE